MKRLALLLSLIAMPAYPSTLLVDKVPVTYCGGTEVYANGTVSYQWPCVIFRDSFSSRELPRK